MKTIVLILFAFALFFGANAQTNTFPPTGSAGIGTTSPTHSLTFGSTATGVAAYNTTDQTTNFERVRQYWSGNIFNTVSEIGGSGTTRSLNFQVQNAAGTTYNGYTINYSGIYKHKWMVTSSGTGQIGYTFGGNFTQSSTAIGVLSSLPSINQSGSAGYRALWVSPYESSTGSGIKYLIDAGTNTAADGAGTHTSKFIVKNDGTGYFASKLGIGISNPQAVLQVGAPASSLPSTNVSESQVITTGNRVGDTAGSILYSSEYDINGSTNVNRFQTVLYRRVAGTAWQGNEYRLQYAVDNSFTTGSKAFIAVGGSDPNSSGGGFVSLATGGTDRLSVNSAGNVGIGTTAPQNKLHVYNSTSDASGMVVQGNTINVDGLQHYTGLTLDGDYGNGTGNYSQIRSYSNLYASWGSQLAFFTTKSGVTNTLAERMRIDAAGNIGIGTATPGTTLDVNGATATYPTTTIRNTSYNSASPTGTSALGLYFADHGAAKIEASKYSTNIADLNFYGEYGFNVPSPIMTLHPTSTTGGDVGIGTTTPLSGGAAASWLTLNGASTYSGGNIYAVSGVAKGSSYYDYATSSMVLQGASGVNVSLQPGGVAALTATATGNVGIGTTTPDTRLAVNGTVHSKEVKVDLTGWPDYVFKPEYQLPSLTEVKTYINQNQHLPDMPSEQEVAKNGLELGAMNKLLTKKVEELTLYLIEKDSEDKKKDAILKSQQQQIDELKEQIGILLKR